MTVDLLVKSLGGTSDVARALAINPSVVSNWRRRGTIPAEYWNALVLFAADQGQPAITFESLGQMHAKPTAAAQTDTVEVGT